MSRISYLSDLLASVFARQAADADVVDERSFADLCDAVLSYRGESSGNRLARSLLLKFEECGSDEKMSFFHLLAGGYDIDADQAVVAAQHYAAVRSAENLHTLMESTAPRRQELFRRLNRVPGATNDLVKMRAVLLENSAHDDDLKRIDLDFQHLFRSWFNQGFLVMREIDWHTPANILEKIIKYEAVHAISSWTELRKRLEPDDRRCYAFFHPAMLDEPLIFVEVALTIESPTCIGDILRSDRSLVVESEARTAVFYSISNCQKGLAGVSFGNFLIKQVASELSLSVPSLVRFQTLSPVPGLMRWVDQQASLQDDDSLLVEGDNKPVDLPVSTQWLSLAQRVASSSSYEFTDSDKSTLQKLVAYFLTQVRRADRQAYDPVARFHLGNGASLDAVWPCADVFGKGLTQSAGVMVSYLYDLDEIASNHELYANERQINASDSVLALLKNDRDKR